MRTGASERISRCVASAYRLMLCAFRDAYGREMRLLFTDELRRVLRTGRLSAVLIFCTAMFVDWSVSVVKERISVKRLNWVIGVPALMLLAIDWLAFHDWREPHTVRDYLTLLASVWIVVSLAADAWNRRLRPL